MSDYRKFREREVAAQEAAARDARRASIAASATAVAAASQAASQERFARAQQHMARMQELQTEAVIAQAQLEMQRVKAEALRASQYGSSAAALHELALEARQLSSRMAKSRIDPVEAWLRLAVLKPRAARISPGEVEPAQRRELAELMANIDDALDDAREASAPVEEALSELLGLSQARDRMARELAAAAQAVPWWSAAAPSHEILGRLDTEIEAAEGDVRRAIEFGAERTFMSASVDLHKSMLHHISSADRLEAASDRALATEPEFEAITASTRRLALAKIEAAAPGARTGLATLFVAAAMWFVYEVPMQSAPLWSEIVFWPIAATLLSAVYFWGLRRQVSARRDASVVFWHVQRTELARAALKPAQQRAAALLTYKSTLRRYLAWQEANHEVLVRRREQFAAQQDAVGRFLEVGASL